MFFLDGCFLLYFICCWGGWAQWLEFYKPSNSLYKTRLVLVREPTSLSCPEVVVSWCRLSMEDMIEDFVTSNIPMPRGIVGILKIHVPCHLLHFLQGAFLGRLETTQTELRINPFALHVFEGGYLLYSYACQKFIMPTYFILVCFTCYLTLSFCVGQ